MKKEIVAFFIDFAYVGPLAIGLGVALGHGQPFLATTLVVAALAIHWRRRARRYDHGRALDREDDVRTTNQELLARLEQARKQDSDECQ